MPNIPFQTIDWGNIEKVTYPGETGTAYWQTLQYNDLRIRLVEYSANYKADHWCRKGHIVYCLQGSFVSELENEAAFTLTEGMSYIVSDDLSSHRSISKEDCTLIIIDGNFFKKQLAKITHYQVEMNLHVLSYHFFYLHLQNS